MKSPDIHQILVAERVEIWRGRALVLSRSPEAGQWPSLPTLLTPGQVSKYRYRWFPSWSSVQFHQSPQISRFYSTPDVMDMDTIHSTNANEEIVGVIANSSLLCFNTSNFSNENDSMENYKQYSYIEVNVKN